MVENDNNLKKPRSKSKGIGTSRLFDLSIYTISIIISILCLLPFLRIIAMALSSERKVVTGQVYLLPKEFTLDGIKFILSQNTFQNSFVLSIYVVILTVVFSLIFTIFMAYPLSKNYFKGRKIIMFAVIFTMLFKGGLIPTYSLYKQMNLLNNLSVLILPMIITPFYLIILISFLKGIPNELEESAKIDGASNLRILWQIYVPLSKASIATLTLFIAVARWNQWFDALIFYSNDSANMLQIFLRDIIMLTDPDVQRQMTDPSVIAKLNMAQVQSSALIVSTLPIIIVYPFLQKYFVKGVVLGAIKG